MSLTEATPASTAAPAGPDGTDGPRSYRGGVIRKPAERLEAEITHRSTVLSRSLYELLVHLGELDARALWARWGALSCATWLADTCDLDLGTAHSYVRVARALREHPALDTAMASGTLSYSKARALCPYLTEGNASELIALAASVPAAGLGQAVAAWSRRNEDPEDIDRRQHRERSVRWRTNPDGMIVLIARLQPHRAAPVLAAIDQAVMSDRAPAGASLGAQRADALCTLITDGGANVTTDVVLHVDGTATHLTDGTPISDHAITALLPDAFISLLLHDTQDQPIDASPRRRTPTRRQRRLLDARHPECNHPGCRARTLLQADHIEPYANGGATVVDNLQLLCGTHNRAKGTGPSGDGG